MKKFALGVALGYLAGGFVVFKNLTSSRDTSLQAEEEL